MSESRRPWTPPVLAAGGVAWTGWSLVAVARGTVIGPVTVLTALSGLLLAVGLTGLVFTLDWTYRFPGGEGAALAAVGALSFAVGQGLTVGLGEGDLSTWFVAPGVLALVGGSVLLAAGLLRTRRVPPWLGVLVLAGTVLFLGFNAIPLLAVPFGLAWLALGGHLWRHPDRPTDHIEPSAVRR